MRQKPSRLASSGLIAVVLAQVVMIGGCGGAGAVDPSTGEAPPKNQMEGLQRIRQSNIKHDQTAPPNRRSERRSVASKR